MSRSLAVESEQLLGVIRMAAVNHEAQFYMLLGNRRVEVRISGVERWS